MKERGLGTGAIVAIVVVVVAAVVVGVMAAVFLLGGGGLGSLPLYPGAQKTAENTINGIQAATYTVPASPSDVISWYKSQMAGQGWTLYQEQSNGIVYTKGNDGAMIVVDEADNTTQLTLACGSKDTIIYYTTATIGYPPIAATAAVSDNEIRINVMSGSIPAGEWQYSVSTTSGSYSWTDGSVTLDPPHVSLGTYTADNYYVSLRHKSSTTIYFSNQKITVTP